MIGVRVGVVSWNTASLLRRCLESLPAALEGTRWSVAVVDNDSSDESAEVARACGAEVTVNPVNAGYARAMNQALAGGDAEVFIALNPDTAAPPGSLSELVSRLVRQPRVGLVGPRLVAPDGAVQPSAYRFPSCSIAAASALLPARLQRGRLGRRLWLEAAGMPAHGADVDWLIGAVHVMRAEAVGPAPYDERWFMYVEDLDLCWRLARLGWGRRLEADIAVEHVGGASADQAWSGPAWQRWIEASHDWYALARGTRAMRCWAAVNAAGCGVRGAALLPARSRRGEALDLLQRVPFHARAAVARWR